MTNISASQVKELREKTGLGLMDCKRALQESEGDISLAIDNLRKSSALKAEKKSTRSAVEGVILGIYLEEESKVILIEVNCETDFVSKDKNFLQFCEQVLKTSIDSHNKDNLLKLVEDKLEPTRQNLIQKLGENIVIRKVDSIEGENVSYYIHSNKKIASAVALSSGNQELAKDISMHITAAKPLSIGPEDLSKELIDKEKEIIKSQIEEEKKPVEILEKMTEGRLNKYLSEVSLIKQPFIKDPSKTVEKLLKEAEASVSSFLRIEIGEGVEIEEVDFASEVMAQIKDS